MRYGSSLRRGVKRLLTIAAIETQYTLFRGKHHASDILNLSRNTIMLPSFSKVRLPKTPKLATSLHTCPPCADLGRGCWVEHLIFIIVNEKVSYRSLKCKYISARQLHKRPERFQLPINYI